MKTTKSLTFMQIIFLLNCLIFSTLPGSLSAQSQLSGSITAVKDSDGNELGGNNPETGEIYTIEFTGEDIKDIHIKLGTDTAEVCYHADSIPATAGADCDIDVYPGSFTESGDHIEDGTSNARNGKYISLWTDEAIESGSFQIRLNKGTLGKAIIIVATSDGNSDPWDGTLGDDYTVIVPDDGVSYPPTLISTEEVPTLSEWGVITLILLTLSMGMVFLYRRETDLAVAGNIPTGNSASKQKLFDKLLYAKVFGVALLIGFSILGLSYLYFGGITSADPFGTFISSAIVAYMVHLWILKKSESE